MAEENPVAEEAQIGGWKVKCPHCGKEVEIKSKTRLVKLTAETSKPRATRGKKRVKAKLAEAKA